MAPQNNLLYAHGAWSDLYGATDSMHWHTLSYTHGAKLVHANTNTNTNNHHPVIQKNRTEPNQTESLCFSRPNIRQHSFLRMACGNAHTTTRHENHKSVKSPRRLHYTRTHHRAATRSTHKKASSVDKLNISFPCVS